jgi:phenylacetate-CoA ligase
MANGAGEYFDELETISPAARSQYLNEKLVKTVRFAYRHSSLTRNIMDKAGVKPSQIQSMEDLQLLPVTRKNDLIEAQRLDPPFGGLLTIPAEKVERIFISPGPIYECQASQIQWFARSFFAAGFREGDIVVNTFTYHMSPAGMLFHEGLRKCGATVVVMGTGNTDILLKTMLDLKVTGFVGTPSFLMAVIKRAEEMEDNFVLKYAINKAWFTGEMLAPSVRAVLEEKYRVSTFQAYAVTEPGGAIAYECREKGGMHMMEEYVLEIVDLQTGKQLKPGETGEIVVTPIHNKSWGLLRFGTGDLSSYTTAKCACGRTSHKITGLVGRASDAVKVRGMFIVARQVEQLLGGFDSVARFQIIVDRRENRDEMKLRLELKDAIDDRTRLSAEINQRFQDLCRLKMDAIEFVPPGVILDPHKTIEDIRKWE